MKGLLGFLKFFCKVLLIIWLPIFTYKLFKYLNTTLPKDLDISKADIVGAATLMSFLNAFAITTLVLLFLIASYYWNVGKSKIRRKKRLKK